MPPCPGWRTICRDHGGTVTTGLRLLRGRCAPSPQPPPRLSTSWRSQYVGKLRASWPCRAALSVWSCYFHCRRYQVVLDRATATGSTHPAVAAGHGPGFHLDPSAGRLAPAITTMAASPLVIALPVLAGVCHRLPRPMQRTSMAAPGKGHGPLRWEPCRIESLPVDEANGGTARVPSAPAWAGCRSAGPLATRRRSCRRTTAGRSG